MSQRRHHMRSTLEDMDRLILSLRDDVGMSLKPEAAFRFELCISEALANLVAHAKPKGSNVWIDLLLTENEDAVIVEIFDPKGAAPFDLRDHAPELDHVRPLAESGRGLAVIMWCSDAVEYGPVGGRNRLALTFLKSGNSRSRHGQPMLMQSGERS